ncbi:Putative signal peptide peptidase SppA [Polystyrenella longa]|uniref:Signal peptide peptidase SppA n=1 Tax=Polystyrenella longa TaxID=2528007 RepID=A0A518CJR2_9PLAN|nr:signal peptide peptidase SppA [Polystyrenella longa]QDU79460.1 Putative signal peptide peptidase SppA [Polystyrenella longa]
MAKSKADGQEIVLPEGEGRSTIVINNNPGKAKWVKILLVISLIVNVFMYSAYQEYFQDPHEPQERFHDGDASATDKVARISVDGVIFGKNTTNILKSINKAQEDENVKAILLSVDSPGGGAPDSHQIYHELKKLSAQKPMYVHMKKYAASGGYYVAMGAGTEAKIFAEPTTWTGSIGVIIPRFNLTGLEEKLGIRSAPIKSGPFKDSPSPFRDLEGAEKELWDAIIADSLGLFTGVIVENRTDLDEAEVDAIATGQVYTASQALANGLVDQIGYEEDALTALGEKAGFDPEKVRIIDYYVEPTITEALMGTSAKSPIEQQWEALVQSTIPRAMYLCSWLPIGTGE